MLRPDPWQKFTTWVDLLYVGGVIVAFAVLYFIFSPILYVVYPIVLFSLCLDWQSARVAQRREHPFFLISDLLTVFNYISLVMAMTLRATAPLNYSKFIWINYGLIFLIYIIWNIYMIRLPDTDAASRKFFFRYNIAGLPVVVIAAIMFFEAHAGFLSRLLGINILKYGDHLLLSVAAYHLAIMLSWIYQTYLVNRRKSTP